MINAEALFINHIRNRHWQIELGHTAFGKLCAGNICSNINFKTIGYGTVS